MYLLKTLLLQTKYNWQHFEIKESPRLIFERAKSVGQPEFTDQDLWTKMIIIVLE